MKFFNIELFALWFSIDIDFEALKDAPDRFGLGGITIADFLYNSSGFLVSIITSFILIFVIKWYMKKVKGKFPENAERKGW